MGLLKLLNKKILILLLFIATLSFSLYMFSLFTAIPNNIRLIYGSEKSLDFRLPARAVFGPETENILSINDKPITDNPIVSLSDDVTLSALGSGSTQMTVNAFGIPLRRVRIDVLPDMEVIPVGRAVGVRINSDGLMVLGIGPVTATDGTSKNPCEGILKQGDLLIYANSQRLSNKEQLMQIIKNSKDFVSFKIKRDGIISNVKIPTVKDSSGINRIGVWVRDSTQGIGTITYYNPATGRFAALGHGVQDVDTKKLLNVKGGFLMDSQITSVRKALKGSPGELIGDINTSKIFGYVKHNSNYGIYGTLEIGAIPGFPKERYRIGLKDSIREGPAKILSCVNGNEVREYDVFIETINRNTSDDTKGMIVRITDPALLARTNGIVQGMSGSPIIQDGRLIGAITHVFVQDPTKGYGIFIENMLAEEARH
ncbi:MAG: SpoIVB peptidase [Defluviitaleaceae bacterium]|nr:SpoIVB peptidase [Defluviitaleaceae bacterium]